MKVTAYSIFRAELTIEPAELADLERICREPDTGVKGDGVEFDEEVTFSDGRRMAIQVCASGDPANEPCWTQGVLFEADGTELACTDCGESVAGEYCVSYDGTDYVVVVK